MRLRRSLSIVMASLGAGCTTAPQLMHLNESARSVPMVDVANLLDPRDIPYEFRDQGDVAVGYNLMYVPAGPTRGLRLTLVIRNKSDSTRNLHPVVELSDRNGLTIPSSTYESFVRDGAVLAGTPIPLVPNFTPAASTSTITSGTMTNLATGSTYRYQSNSTTSSGTPMTNAVNSYAQGVAIRQSRDAAKSRETGAMMIRWANAFWLRQTYVLESGKAASGALHFPGASPSQLPLELTVDVGGQRITFHTRAAL